MVREDNEVATKKILSPFLHRAGYGTQFPDISRSSEKLWAKRFAKEGNGVPLLWEDRTHAYPRRVGLDYERHIKIRQDQNWSWGHGLLELIKICLSLCRPLELIPCCHLDHWCCNGGIATNEPAVEAGKTQEASHGFYGTWCGPLLNCGNLRGHRFHASARYHVSEILHLRLRKKTLRQF